MPSDRQIVDGTVHLVRTNTGTPDLPTIHVVEQQGDAVDLIEVAHEDVFPLPGPSLVTGQDANAAC